MEYQEALSCNKFETNYEISQPWKVTEIENVSKYSWKASHTSSGGGRNYGIGKNGKCEKLESLECTVFRRSVRCTNVAMHVRQQRRLQATHVRGTDWAP